MVTLKISDLSVGDWVSFDTAYLTVEGDDIASAFVKKVQQPARIKSILGDQDLIFAEVENEDDFGTIYLKMEHILPIPITAEILEKNGFECSYEDADTILYGVPWCSIIFTKKPLSYRFYSPLVSVVCSNIHNLQHALRLAGVDKEINL